MFFGFGFAYVIIFMFNSNIYIKRLLMKFFKQNSKKELFFQILLILNTLLLITLIIFVTIDAQDNMWRHVKTLQEVDDIKIQLKK